MNASFTLGVSSEMIGYKHKRKVFLVLYLACIPCRFCCLPAVKSRARNARNTAQLCDRQQIIRLRQCLLDQGELYFRFCLNSNCFRASVYAAYFLITRLPASYTPAHFPAVSSVSERFLPQSLP